MRGISLDKMTADDLREAVSVMSRRGGGAEPPRLRAWSREKCVKWLHDNPVPNGVGNFCKNLLRVVVGRTTDGFVIGLSYSRMVCMIKTHYPCSHADQKHLRWYATTMRAAGEMIPVHRERSKWRNED